VKAEINNVAVNEVFAKDAYARVKDEWSALQPDQLLQVNLDIPIAAQTVLGALPEIKSLRERIVKELPSFDIASFDKLEDYVLALVVVNSRYVMATQPPDDLNELSAESARLRERLTADARTLSLRGLFDARKVAALKGGQGYRNIGLDLQSLSEELESIWPTINGKCATTAEELKAATQMATRLLRVVGLRDQAPAIVGALVEERMRAFTHVIKVYEEARSAIAFLRRKEEDADTIAPSLYTGRAPRRKASEPDDDTTGDAGGAGQSPAPVPPTTPSAPPTSSVSSTLPAVTSAEIAKKGPFVA
jgi:hypothetical protein